MRETGRSLGVPVHVFGNETHMTAIVAMALGRRPILSEPEAAQHTANFLLPGGQQTEVVSTPRGGTLCGRAGVQLSGRGLRMIMEK